MKLMWRSIGVCVGGAVLALGGTGGAASSDIANSESAYLSDLFAGRTVAHIQIQISADGMRDLSRYDGDNHHRPFALARVNEEGNLYTNVEVHVKGGAGSYRPIYNNPALTLNFAKYAPGQSFHGLKKFSLNNSVQDPTFLNEKIAASCLIRSGALRCGPDLRPCS